MDNNRGGLLPALNEQIRDEIARINMSQANLADAAGVGAIAMNRYLNGHRTIPLPTLINIAAVLGVAPSTLVARAEKRAAKRS